MALRPVPPVATAAVLCLLVAALGVGGASATPGAELTYRGTMRVAVAYWGYDCRFWPAIRDTRLRRQGTRTYTMPVSVIRNPPASDGDVREKNPFNLVVSADQSREAGITIVSATVTANPQTGERTLFEYWRFTRNGPRLNGRLRQTWRQAGITLNVFPTDRLIVPCRPDLGTFPRTLQPIVEGARLTGTFTDRRFELVVSGRTLDKERRFTARIVTTR